jgi:hypothetical protein
VLSVDGIKANIMIKWLIFIIRIHKVLDSNFGPELG